MSNLFYDSWGLSIFQGQFFIGIFSVISKNMSTVYIKQYGTKDHRCFSFVLWSISIEVRSNSKILKVLELVGFRGLDISKPEYPSDYPLSTFFHFQICPNVCGSLLVHSIKGTFHIRASVRTRLFTWITKDLYIVT